MSTSKPETLAWFHAVSAGVQAAAAGASKAGLTVGKTFTLGVLGGAFIGFGSFLAISVGAACPGLLSTNPGLQKMVYGAFGLPFGLLLVLMCGAELFTGNTALVTAAVRHPPNFSTFRLNSQRAWHIVIIL